jgi:hypothetical protein
MKPSAIPPPRPRPDAAPMDGRSRRVDVRVAVRAVLRPLANGADAGPEIYGWVGNLSTGGAWVRAVEPLPPETFCEVRLVWKDGAVFRAVFLKGWVVYAGEAGMGLQFESVGSELQAVLHRLDHPHVSPAV